AVVIGAGAIGPRRRDESRFGVGLPLGAVAPEALVPAALSAVSSTSSAAPASSGGGLSFLRPSRFTPASIICCDDRLGRPPRAHRTRLLRRQPPRGAGRPGQRRG